MKTGAASGLRLKAHRRYGAAALDAMEGGCVAILDDLRQSVIGGNADRAGDLVKEAIGARLAPEEILKAGLISAMAEVGRMFECGEAYVPEMLIAARAMKRGLTLLRPALVAADVRPLGRVIIGTAQGDIHDIGKNLVAMMLEGAGFEVIDLGTDVAAEKYVQAVREHRPDFVACSALLTTTMLRMQEILLALEQTGLRKQTKVMVGGAPITEEYARQIGADLYAPDAAAAASRARELIASLKAQ
jgi:5-methyltetrahydrofolate--homocysteine methyltransferase